LTNSIVPAGVRVETGANGPFGLAEFKMPSDNLLSAGELRKQMEKAEGHIHSSGSGEDMWAFCSINIVNKCVKDQFK
jgi:hypothetical protein